MNTTQLSNQLETAGNSVAHQASSALEKASDLSHRGAEAIREGAAQVREKAHNIGEHAVGYIQEKPVQSVLIAAATGATLMALLSLIARGARRG